MNILNTLLESAYSDLKQKLQDDGWEETGGVALFTNKKYPNFTLDCNSESIWVLPVRERGPFNNSEDDFLHIADTFAELKSWMKSKDAKDWVSSTPIKWDQKYLKTLADNAKVGSLIVFNHRDEHGNRKKLTGKLVKVSNSMYCYVKVGTEELLVHPSDIINIKHDPEKKAWFLTDDTK